MLSNSAKCPCGSLSRNINIFNFTHSYISCTICHYTYKSAFLKFTFKSSFFNWVAIDNTKFLYALSFMYCMYFPSQLRVSFQDGKDVENL